MLFKKLSLIAFFSFIAPFYSSSNAYSYADPNNALISYLPKLSDVYNGHWIIQGGGFLDGSRIITEYQHKIFRWQPLHRQSF